MADDSTPGTLEKAKKFVKDGYKNLLLGLGSKRSAKKEHTKHILDGLLEDGELESMFVEEGLAARVVKLLPDDMLREKWKYKFPDTDVEKIDELKAAEYIDVYDTVFETINAQQKIKEALYWKRLHGGAAILIGVIDGQTAEQPLDPKRIKSFEKLKVIDRTEIDFSRIQFQTDPNKPRYGLPAYYPIKFDINTGVEAETLVHYSRIIELHGDTLPRKSETAIPAEKRYWGISVLQRADDHLKTLGSSMGSIDQLLDEISVGKYKVKDLAILLSSPEGKAAIQRRVELMDITRSVFHSQYLDTDEEFSRDTVNFTGVPEILYILFMLISSDTGYPITRLFGVSPGGMNATGESDMRNYYDGVRSEQNTELLPVLNYILHIISKWKNIPEPYIVFAPLQTMNDKEQSDLEKQNADKDKIEAETYKIYVEMGALEPYEVRFLKFGKTLDAIPVQAELPPVETVPKGKPEDNETKTEDTLPSPKPRNSKAGK